MLIEIKMGNRPKFENLSMADLYWFHSLGPLSNLTNDESVIEVMDILSSTQVSDLEFKPFEHTL